MKDNVNQHNPGLKDIGYCGLYCPKCYKNEIANSAENLLNKLESIKNKGDEFLQKNDLKNSLENLIKLRCKNFCRNNGGKSCAIKICCAGQKIIGCWKCKDFGVCKKLKPQFLENNKKLRRMSVEEYIKYCQI